MATAERSSLITAPDPGPLARFTELAAEPERTLADVVARITDAENPQTLKEVAKAWKVPYGRLRQWIAEDAERTDRYVNACRFAAEAAGWDVLSVADTADEDNHAAVKVKVQARQWIASRMAREQFGESSEVRHTGALSLIAVLSGMPRAARGTPEPAEVIDVTPVVKIPEKIQKPEEALI